MTPREIFISLENIARRKHNEFILGVTAIRVGFAAKPPNLNYIPSACSKSVKKFSAFQDKILEKAAKAAQDRKLKEMKERGSN